MGQPVKITPPGDVRPAFDSDIQLIRKTIDRQWGEGYSKYVIPDDKVVLLNNSPDVDRMDEVIVDGKVRGILRYCVDRKIDNKEPFVFLIRPWETLPTPKKGYVVMDKGAVKPISNGASALAVGILEADEKIAIGDEVLILGPDKKIIGTGPSYKNGDTLLNADRGKGVKVRWKVSKDEIASGTRTWDDVIKANEDMMKKKVEEGKRFILSKIEEYDLPYAVSYSGGKDSLAVLHLVMDADLKPDLLFVDTGIELPETLDNIEEVVNKHDLNLLKADSKDGYWNNILHFGPSARDYRWCCKTCKLGPTGLLIKKHFPKGVLSFIGQRRYESQNRMEHGDTWTNPWVPGQIGASPIQDWTALHVWLYLFMKKASYNPWYEKGFERIGCWVCPASDLAELEFLKEEFDGYSRFEEFLKDHKKKRGLSQAWIDLGLWRWLNVPKEIMDMINAGGEARTEHEPALNDELMEHPMMKVLGEKRSKEDILNIQMRIQHCSECGVCVSACPEDALYLKQGINIYQERCTSCGRCLKKCPIIEYTHRVIKDL